MSVPDVNKFCIQVYRHHFRSSFSMFWCKKYGNFLNFFSFQTQTQNHSVWICIFLSSSFPLYVLYSIVLNTICTVDNTYLYIRQQSMLLWNSSLCMFPIVQGILTQWGTCYKYYHPPISLSQRQNHPKKTIFHSRGKVATEIGKICSMAKVEMTFS